MISKLKLKQIYSSNQITQKLQRCIHAQSSILDNYVSIIQPEQAIQHDVSPLLVEQFAQDLINRKYKKVAFLTGAGVSVSAGIPDFRSPDTGLYAQIKKDYNIRDPMKIFSIKYFKENPHPFLQVIRDFFSRQYEPTFAHNLINIMNQRKQLLVNITQNIDGLELKAGIPPQKIIQAHGHARDAHCIFCNHQVSIQKFIENCQNLKTTHCPKCQNFVKPKIVFFGEILPEEFYKGQDVLDKADCIVVMGTSLKVFPFSGLISNVKSSVPIVVINNQLPKNVNNLSNQIQFLQGDINNISQQIFYKLLQS